MRSPDKFLVTPYNGRRYDNIEKIGGVEVVIGTSEEDHITANRLALVLETPLGYNGDIKKGDILIVHHNTFKIYLDTDGKRRSMATHFRDMKFFVGDDLFYLYGNEGNWKCHDRYCFVKPIKSPEMITEYLPLTGEMKFVNDTLQKNGVKRGDKVIFKPHSEYEFRIDGELLYRVFDHSIVAIV